MHREYYLTLYPIIRISQQKQKLQLRNKKYGLDNKLLLFA